MSRSTQSFLSSRSYQQAITRQLSEQMLDKSVPMSAQLNETSVAVAKTLHVDACLIVRLIRPDTLRVVAATGWHDLLGDHLPPADTLIGHTMAMADEAVICENVWEDERFSVSDWERERNALAALCCCIPGSDERLWGAIIAYHSEVRSFEMEDGHFLETLANLISAAVQRDQLLKSYTESLQRIDTLRQQIAKAIDQGLV